MKCKRGEVVWVRFPFSDASSGKRRPALIISNESVNATGDYLLMQITSKIRGDNLSYPILQNDFVESPLLKQSELRLHKIFILSEGLIETKITSVPDKFINNMTGKFLMLIS